MKKYVLDASAVLVLVLENRDSLVEKVKTIFKSSAAGKAKLISSQLLKLEVANGIRFNEKDETKAQRLYKSFFDLPIKFIDLSESLYNQSLKISYNLGTTVYDTSYHILAKSQNAIFLTCDEKYYNKAEKLGNIELVK